MRCVDEDPATRLRLIMKHPPSGAVAAHGTVHLDLSGAVPAGTRAAVPNLTLVGPIVWLSPDLKVDLYHGGAGTVHLIAGEAGYVSAPA